MEQGFPPGRIVESHAIFLAHSVMLMLLTVMALLVILSWRRRADRSIIKYWGRGLVGLLAVSGWVSIASNSYWASEARPLFANYVGGLLLSGVVVMQVCDFCVWRQKKALGAALGLTLLMGVARTLFVLSGGITLALIPSIFPRQGTVSDGAWQSECRSRIRLLGNAIFDHLADNGSHYPRPTTGIVPVSWRVNLLPYLQNIALRKSYDDSLAWDDDKNLPVAQHQMLTLQCPTYRSRTDDLQRYFTSFVMVTGPGTVAPGDCDIRPTDVRDGTSNTAMLVEAVGLNVVWTEPRDADVTTTPIGINLKGRGQTDSPGLLSSYHSAGRAYMTMADGSVRTINERIDPQVLKSLTTINGNELLPQK